MHLDVMNLDSFQFYFKMNQDSKYLPDIFVCTKQKWLAGWLILISEVWKGLIIGVVLGGFAGITEQ